MFFGSSVARIVSSNMSTVIVTCCLLLVKFGTCVSQSVPGLGSTRIDLGLMSLAIPNDPVQEFVSASKCMGPLGCFSNDPPFYDPVRRPISVLPYDRSIMDIKFRLYTRKNPEHYQLLSENDREGLLQSNFNPEHKTYFIIHGFLDNVAFARWIPEFVTLLLMRDEGNVIVVDWGRANKFPYFQAVANTRVLGAETALLIKTLQEVRKADPEKMHVIGHSLGAQTAGYVGERITNLGRITGLDPAGPYYTGTDPSVRLDPTDAKFVDNIHTDASLSIAAGLGTVNSVGHIDFFPNSGDNQPGCDVPLISMKTLDTIITQGMFEGARESAFICDHQRAVSLFAASIMPGSCMPVAQSCSGWKDFINGKCGDCEDDGSRCAVMGMDSFQFYKRSPKYREFYLRTSGKHPFCLHHYQVTLVMGDNKEAREVHGMADIVIHGNKAHLKAKLSHSGETFKPGSYHTYLVASKRDIGEFDSINFHWKKKSGSEDSFADDMFRDTPSDRQDTHEAANEQSDLYVRLVRISPLVMPSRTGKKLTPRTMCGKGNTQVPLDKTVTLASDENC